MKAAHIWSERKRLYSRFLVRWPRDGCLAKYCDLSTQEGRKKWLAAATSGQKRPRRRPPRVDDEVILETIFAKPTGWLLPHPVPLAHMVELLEDEWSD